MRKQSEFMFKEINIKTKLDMGIIEELFNRFTRADQSKSGFVTKYDVEDVIRDVDNMKLNDQLKAKLKEEVNNQSKNIDFKQICDIFNVLNKLREDQEDEDGSSEYIDAFVALGGQHDKSGTISKETIIRVIKNEFELTFDIEELCERVGVSTLLDFASFCLLFDSSEEARSTFSEAQKEKDNQTTVFKVRYKDFENWEKKQNELQSSM